MNQNEKDGLRRLRDYGMSGQELNPSQLALFKHLRLREAREAAMNQNEKDELQRLRDVALSGQELNPTQLALFEDLQAREAREAGVTAATGPEVGVGHVWVADVAVQEPATSEQNLYTLVGQRLKDHRSVVKVKDKLEALRAMPIPLPFALISAPSGAGKTQMPFSLRAAGLNLIHLAVGIPYRSDEISIQDVYLPMRYNSINLRMAVLEDFHRNGNFGVAASATGISCLSLMNQGPLFTVEWLCRLLNITVTGPESCSLQSLNQRISQTTPESRPIVFLDEIYNPGDKEWTLVHVRFLRNVLRAAGIVAVLMGTNCSAIDLVENSRIGSRGGGARLWCRLISDLPKISVESAEPVGVTSAVAKINSRAPNHDSLAQLLQESMLSSNCWLVRLFARVVNDLTDEAFDCSTAELVDHICGKVHTELKLRKRMSLTGQLCLQLRAYHDNVMSAKSWMTSTLLLVEHFASLTGGDRDTYISGGEEGLVEFDSYGRIVKVNLGAKFASASEDPLLYLVLCGGVKGKGRVRAPRRPFYGPDEGITTHSTMMEVCYPGIELRNLDAASRSGDALEVLAMVSIGTASRLSGLRGTTLHDFLPLLCAELLLNPAYEPVTWEECSEAASTDLTDTKFKDYLMPYIGVDSSPWSQEVVNLQGSNVANIRRTRNKERVDLKVEYPNSAPTWTSMSTAAAADNTETASALVREGFAVECKNYDQNLDLDTLRGALERVPPANSLHFVFCRTTQNRYFTRASWPAWSAQHGHTNTNVALVRCVEGKMRLVELSSNMLWVPWADCAKLVIVIAVDELTGAQHETLKRPYEEISGNDSISIEEVASLREQRRPRARI